MTSDVERLAGRHGALLVEPLVQPVQKEKMYVLLAVVTGVVL